MRPSEWYREFISKRGLTGPNGRPLYQYRMTDAEYRELQQALKHNPLNMNSPQLWDACFVLFASAWWFRKYSGGAWRWDSILREVSAGGISFDQRSELVKGGLRKLGRSLFQDSGSSEYLATIVQEAGIPMETLNNSGWLRKFILVVYRAYAVQESNYVSLTSSLDDLGVHMNIPDTFRNGSFYGLIKELTQKIYRLKKEHTLGEKQNPLEYLDSIAPNWSESLPVPIESEAGRNFLKGLLSDLSAIREPDPYPIEIDRVLQRRENDWSIELSLALPEQPIDFDDLRLSSETQEALKQIGKVSVELKAGMSFERTLGVAYHTRRDNRDLIQLPRVDRLSIPSAHAFEHFELRLQHNGECMQTLVAGNELDANQPLVFAETTHGIHFIHQGSLRTSSGCIYAIIGHAFKVRSGNPITLGKYNETNALFKIQEPTDFTNEEGERLSFAVNSTDRDEWKYDIVGTTLPSFITPNQASVYIGKPRVYQTNKNTEERMPFPDPIEFRATGANQSWQSLSDSHSGQGRIRLRGKSGELLYTCKVFLLPQGFGMRLRNSNDIKKGSIIVTMAGALDVTVVSTEVNSATVTRGSEMEISLESLTGSPPEFVRVRVAKQLLDDLILQFPFPSFGAQVFRMGNLLRRSDTIYSSELHGIRIRMHLSDRPELFQIELRATGNSETADLYYQQEYKVSDHVREIALSGLKEEIDRLMAAQSQLDKTLVLEIKDSRGKGLLQNQIRQYSMIFVTRSCENGKAVVKADVPNKDAVPPGIKFASYLFDQYNYTSTSRQVIAQETSTPGEFILVGFSESEQASTCFVYPAKDSSSMFRPFTILTGPREQEEKTEVHCIKEAAFIRDFEARTNALLAHVGDLALDFDHEDWNEIAWQCKATNHLPMASLDIWTAFSKDRKALIALFCMHGGELVDRLTSEYPILLEIISVDCWQEVLFNYHRHLQIRYDEPTARILLDAKLSEIATRFGLNGLEVILRNDLLPETLEHQPLTSQMMKFTIRQEYERLIRAGINPDTLPFFLSSELSKAVSELPEQIQSIVPEVSAPRFKPIVYLPILLAFKSVHLLAYPIELIPAQVYKIRRMKRFRLDWFDPIYDYVQGYCWQIKESFT